MYKYILSQILTLVEPVEQRGFRAMFKCPTVQASYQKHRSVSLKLAVTNCYCVWFPRHQECGQDKRDGMDGTSSPFAYSPVVSL